MRTGTSALRQIGSANFASLRVIGWSDYEYDYDRSSVIRHRSSVDYEHEHDCQSVIRNYSAAFTWSHTFVYLALSAPRSSMTSLLALISAGTKTAGLFRISAGSSG